MSDTVSTPALDVLVVGGGQAGLAMGHELKAMGLRFEILDAGASVGESWRDRWDSLLLFTPAQYDSLPGMPFPAPRDTYPGKEEVADYLRAYAEAFQLPIRSRARVTSLVREDGWYLAAAGTDAYRARQVVVATGPFQVPFTPPVAQGFSSAVFQVHSSTYRNPSQLPEGPAIVVGGGNSGFQIAEELAASREVALSVGTKAPLFPQRLLGRDLSWWLDLVGVYRAPTNSRLGRRIRSRPDPVIGSSRRRLRQMGVSFRPRLTEATGRGARFADGSELEVDSVVWATGFRTDHSWIDVPGALDGRGEPLHRRGVTEVPGLYFLGLSWLHTRGSALLGWVKDDAAFLAQQVAWQREGVDDGVYARRGGTEAAPA